MFAAEMYIEATIFEMESDRARQAERRRRPGSGSEIGWAPIRRLFRRHGA